MHCAIYTVKASPFWGCKINTDAQSLEEPRCSLVQHQHGFMACMLVFSLVIQLCRCDSYLDKSRLQMPILVQYGSWYFLLISLIYIIAGADDISQEHLPSDTFLHYCSLTLTNHLLVTSSTEYSHIPTGLTKLSSFISVRKEKYVAADVLPVCFHHLVTYLACRC